MYIWSTSSSRIAGATANVRSQPQTRKTGVIAWRRRRRRRNGGRMARTRVYTLLYGIYTFTTGCCLFVNIGCKSATQCMRFLCCCIGGMLPNQRTRRLSQSNNRYYYSSNKPGTVHLSSHGADKWEYSFLIHLYINCVLYSAFYVFVLAFLVIIYVLRMHEFVEYDGTYVHPTHNIPRYALCGI